MTTRRRVRNTSVVWVTLLLLQQFQLVLLLNIEDLKSNESFYQTLLLNNDGNLHHNVNKRDTGADVDVVLVAVKTAGEAIKAKVDNWKTMLENITCDVEEEAEIRRVWTDTVFVLHFYLSSSVIFSYIKSCQDVMRNQVWALLNAVGTSDAAVELVNDAKDYILSDILRTEADEDIEPDDESVIDPESTANERLKDISYLIANNIASVHEFSDILLSFNSSTQRSMDGIESHLNEAIDSFLIAESMLEDGNVRKKRSNPNSKADTSSSKRSPEIWKPISKSDQMKNMLTYKQYKFNDGSKQRIVKKVNQFRSNYRNSKPVARKHIPKRLRRSIDTDVVANSSIVFVKNEIYPCKLLSFQQERLGFKHYDELLLTTQMWIWSDGYLQNYETGLFLQKTNKNEFVVSADIPQDKLTLEHGSWFRFEQDTGLICVNDTYGTLQHCGVLPQMWTFISIDTAESSISSIACLFFIQSIDTCLVLTSVGSESKSLEMRSISLDSVDNQLWYQDFVYFRLARNHEYLARKSGNGISLMNSRDDTAQRWVFVNNVLINLGDENTVLVPSVRQPYIESLYDVENISDIIYQTRLREIHEEDESNCATDEQLFFITNDDVSCKILCAKQDVLNPSSAVRFGIPFASFAAGFIAGLLSLFCLEKKEAIGVSVGLGISLAVIYTVVAEVTQFLFKVATIAYFNEYEYSEFDKCVWHQISGTLENMHFEKILQVEEINSINSIILSEESNQIWFYRNKSIIRDNMACGLTLTDTVGDNSNDDMLATVCSSEQVKYMKWNRILIDNSTDFFKEIKCLYFLKSTADKTCGVLTVKSNTNYSETSVLLPSPNYLMDQLWYVENNSMISLQSDNISVNIDNGSYESIPFKEKNIEFQTTIACESGRFFIKTESVPCKVLSVSDDGDLLFMDYNHNKFMHQLWSWDDKRLKNIGSNKYLSRTKINSENNYEHLTVSDSSELMWNIAKNKIVRIDASCSFSVELDKFSVPYVVCQKDINFASNWSVTYFDENFNFAEDVLCPFFIQDQFPPCGYLVGNRSTGRTFVGPMSRDLFEHQLWYRSGDVVFHLESGLPLSISDAGFVLFTGDDASNVSIAKVMKENDHDYLCLSEEGNIKITVGRIILFDSAINYEAKISCPNYNRTFFFLKNSVESCKVATPDSTNDYLSFDIFDENRFEEQLWYFEFNRIINLQSGKVLSLFRAANGEYLVKLVELLFLDGIQTFNMDLQVTAKINKTHTCNLEYSTNLGFVQCTFSSDFQATWTSINYETALSNLNDIMCLFYIRSNITPCEFIAGYDNERLLVRPATEELIVNQVFYWKDQFIIHKGTGFFLSGNVDTMTVSLQQENQLYHQQWSINGNKIVSGDNSDLFVAFSTYDGNVLLQTKTALSTLSNWMIVPINYNFEKDNITNPHCYTEEQKELNPFFLFIPGETKLGNWERKHFLKRSLQHLSNHSFGCSIVTT